MQEQDQDKKHNKRSIQPQWVLFGLFGCVLLFLGLVFIHPAFIDVMAVSSAAQLPVNPAQAAETEEAVITPTPAGEATTPTQDEIGSTDGIIFWATLLVLILIIGTLRETIKRKGR